MVVARAQAVMGVTNTGGRDKFPLQATISESLPRKGRDTVRKELVLLNGGHSALDGSSKCFHLLLVKVTSFLV